MQLSFENTVNNKPLTPTSVVVTDANDPSVVFTDGQDGYVNGTAGIWVKKGPVGYGTNGATSLTATATYNGIDYPATISFNSTHVIKPEAFAISTRANFLYAFNGFYDSLATIRLSTGVITKVDALPADAKPISVFIAENESDQVQASSWVYTLGKTTTGRLFALRVNNASRESLTYVQTVGSPTGAGYGGDFLKDVTSMVLNENSVLTATDDRLLVLQHDAGSAFVSQLDVGDKALSSKSPAPIFGTFSPTTSLYTRVWTQPAGITNADKIAFDTMTNTLVVLDNKGATSDVIGYRMNAGGTAYDVQQFKTTIGGNNSRVVAAVGKVFVSEGSALTGNLKINSIDAQTGVKSVIYDDVVGSGQKLSAVSDIRVDRTGKLYVLDGVANAIITINTASTTASTARVLLKSYNVSTGPGFTPNDIAYDGFANFFVTDSNQGGIVGVGAANGVRTKLRSGLTANGQHAVAQQIKYNDTQGLITAEHLLDATGGVTGKALAKTALLSPDLAAPLAPFSPMFNIDQLGVYVDPARGNYAVNVDGSSINVTDIATGTSVSYNQFANPLGFSADTVSAVELDQKSGLLYVINNMTKQLYKLNLKVAMAMPEPVTTVPAMLPVTKPTDIVVDGTDIYYLDSGTLYKVDTQALGNNVTAVTSSATPGIKYPDLYTPIGINVLGEQMEIDSKNRVMWIINKRAGSIIGVSLITGDRVVIAH